MPKSIFTSVVPFSFENHSVRAINRNGDIWFVAADVGAVLGLTNVRASVALLDDDEKGVNTIDTPSGRQEMSIINESGLYALILRSRKAEAKRFRKWVTSEVLPSIRKTGYLTHATAARHTDRTTLSSGFRPVSSADFFMPAPCRRIALHGQVEKPIYLNKARRLDTVVETCPPSFLWATTKYQGGNHA